MSKKIFAATSLVLTSLAASPLSAQAVPYKLLVMWGDSGVAVIDYPTKDRCEQAIAVLERRKQYEVEQRKPKRLEGGGVLIPNAWQMEMVCIPG